MTSRGRRKPTAITFPIRRSAPNNPSNFVAIGKILACMESTIVRFQRRGTTPGDGRSSSALAAKQPSPTAPNDMGTTESTAGLGMDGCGIGNPPCGNGYLTLEIIQGGFVFQATVLEVVVEERFLFVPLAGYGFATRSPLANVAVNTDLGGTRGTQCEHDGQSQCPWDASLRYAHVDSFFLWWTRNGPENTRKSGQAPIAVRQC